MYQVGYPWVESQAKSTDTFSSGFPLKNKCLLMERVYTPMVPGWAGNSQKMAAFICPDRMSGENWICAWIP